MSEASTRRVDWTQARERLAQAERSWADHNSDPNRIKAAYRERAAALAGPPKTLGGDTEYRRVAVFRLGGEHYAAPLSSLDRVVPDPVCTPVPGVAECWAGVMVAGGEVIPVLHLARVLGLAAVEPAAERHVLRLRSSERDFGLLVGEVPEIRSYAAGDLRPPGDTLRLIEAVAPGNVLVLDIDALVSQESLQ